MTYMDHEAIAQDVEKAEQIAGLALTKAEFLISERFGPEALKAQPSLAVSLADSIISLLASNSLEKY